MVWGGAPAGGSLPGAAADPHLGVSLVQETGEEGASQKILFLFLRDRRYSRWRESPALSHLAVVTAPCSPLRLVTLVLYSVLWLLWPHTLLLQFTFSALSAGLGRALGLSQMCCPALSE